MSQQTTCADPWEQDSVNFLTYSGSLDEIRSQLRSGTVTWNLVDVLPYDARTGCDADLFEELDRDTFDPAPDGIPRDDDIMLQVPGNCAVLQVFASNVYFYRKGACKGLQPTSITDFFDLAKFSGGRGIHILPNALIEIALLAGCAAVTDVYRIMSTDAVSISIRQ